MANILDLLIAKAYAAEPALPAAASAATAQTGVEGDTLMRFLPLFLIFGVFYFLLIRPQQKKYDQQTKMIKALGKGDKVVTAGGLVGTVTKVDGDHFVFVEIAKGVEVKVVKSTISSLHDETRAETKSK